VAHEYLLMSKAFTRETDVETDDLAVPRSAVPSGARNYVTPDALERWRAELKRLFEDDRPSLLSAKENGDREAAAQLRRLDAKIRDLSERIESAEVVPSPAGQPEEVQFGVTVTVRDDSGEPEQYRIVGIDEVDFAKGWVSWASPIARALLQARVGDRVPLETPAGERLLEVIRIE
jgi:transcription elongation factor GreB